MGETQNSIEEQLVRYRIEKKMAGRRDLLLHGAVYIAVAVILLVSQPWQENMRELSILGGLWTIPLILHGLRYYYRCGPGAIARADEIERAIDEQMERTALDEDEEVLIEERVGKRITARRLVVAHGLAATMIFGLSVTVALVWYNPYFFNDTFYRYAALFLIAFGLHYSCFFFVHGRTPQGRALKIDAEVEREWHRSRERGRHEAVDSADAARERELGDGSGRRLRLSDEGEIEQLDEGLAGGAQAGMGRA